MTDRFEPLLYWVGERERIRALREHERAGPWTQDSILSEYRFCNVRRRDDRVSRWVIKNILHRYRASPQLWLLPAIARYVNWPPALQRLIDGNAFPSGAVSVPEYLTRAAEILDAPSGEKTWTGAYMIRAESNKRAEWYDWGKGRYVMKIVIERELWDNRADFREFFKREIRTVQYAHALLSGRYGWGSFMAGQVVADWTYTPLLEDARDLYTWAPLGPGSTRGLNRLYGRPIDYRLKQEDAIPEMRAARDAIVSDFPDLSDVTLHDVQNCLCEVDKYLRTKNGEGRPRAQFVPETSYQV